jgi:hypothetical protein
MNVGGLKNERRSMGDGTGRHRRLSIATISSPVTPPAADAIDDGAEERGADVSCDVSA